MKTLFILFLLCFQFSNSQVKSLNNIIHFKEDASDKKSVAMAAILSLIIPGLGELYVGNYSSGKYLTGAEAALWLTYFSLNSYGTWLRDDTRKYASMNANVKISGQSEDFYVNIGNYIDVYSYNEKKLQERQQQKLYDPNSINYWKWNSEADRQKYRSQRIASDKAFNDTYFVLGVILANHIISAVNAGMSAIKFNSKYSILDDFKFESRLLGVLNKPDGLLLSISKTF